MSAKHALKRWTNLLWSYNLAEDSFLGREIVGNFPNLSRP